MHNQINYNILSTSSTLSYSGCYIEKISIDAEWYSGKSLQFGKKSISNQSFLAKQATLYLLGKSMPIHIVLWNNTCPSPDIMLWNASKYGELFLIPCPINDIYLDDVLPVLGLEYARTVVEVKMFYATADLSVMMSPQTMMDWTMADSQWSLSRKRNTSGFIKYDVVNNRFMPKENIKRMPQAKNIKPSSKTIYFKIVDLVGAGVGSLDKTFDTFGVDNPWKKLSDNWDKSNMSEFFMKDPNNAMLYSLGDTVFLEELHQNIVETDNRIINEALDLRIEFTTEDYPRSAGALVEKVFRTLLGKELPKALIAVETLADTNVKSGAKHRGYLKYLENSLHSEIVDFQYPHGKRTVTVSKDPSDACRVWDSKFDVSGLSAGSILALGKDGERVGGNLGAIFNGGRCWNEYPERIVLSQILDIDISGCYGGSLASLEYPIGIPSRELGRETARDKCKSLKEMMGTIKKFEPFLWHAVIHTDTDLSFGQDLIYSNPELTPQKIRKMVTNLEIPEIPNDGLEDWEGFERGHLNGGFTLFKKQIVNGIITQKSLEILEATLSNKEKSEFYSKVKVDVVVGYKTSDKCENLDEFVEICKSSKRGCIGHKGNSAFDNRTRKWIGFPMTGYVNGFKALRSKYKKLKAEASQIGDKDSKSKYDSLQNRCKLYINTLYGVLASPFFEVSNVVLANNITDKARCNVWMVAKALGLQMCITDGGVYQINDPRVIVGRKPTLSTMADYVKMNKHRGIRNKVLFADYEAFRGLIDDIQLKGFNEDSKTWNTPDEKLLKRCYKSFKNAGLSMSYEQFLEKLAKGGWEDKGLHGCVDELALTHINGFWGNYGLSLDYELEHKGKNTADKCGVWGKSDYVFLNPAEPGKSHSIKARGTRNENHCKQQFLLFLLGRVNKPNMVYEYDEALGFGDWKNIVSKHVSEEPMPFLYPQSTVRKQTVLRPSTKHIHHDNLRQKQRYEGVINRMVAKHKRLIEEEIYQEFGLFAEMTLGMDVNEFMEKHHLKLGGDVRFENKTSRGKEESVLKIYHRKLDLTKDFDKTEQIITILMDEFSMSRNTVFKKLKEAENILRARLMEEPEDYVSNSTHKQTMERRYKLDGETYYKIVREEDDLGEFD